MVLQVAVAIHAPATTLESKPLFAVQRGVILEVLEFQFSEGVGASLAINLGADFIPDTKNPNVAGPGSDMITPYERVRHILDIKPEISTLDCGSMNYSGSAYIATMDMLRETSKYIMDAGVKAEVEVFELGHIWQAKLHLLVGSISRCRGKASAIFSRPRKSHWVR